MQVVERRYRIEVLGVEDPLVPDPTQTGYHRRCLVLDDNVRADRSVLYPATEHLAEVCAHRAVEGHEFRAQLLVVLHGLEHEGIEELDPLRVALELVADRVDQRKESIQTALAFDLRQPALVTPAAG